MSGCYGSWIWNGSVWTWITGGCSRNVCPPSPTPPWARPVQSPNSQTLTTDGEISLTTDPTFLVRQVADPSVPVELTIPDGNYMNQPKTIMIPGNMLIGPDGPSETFNIAGTFSGYSSLTMNSIAFVAILLWSGSGWSICGGNPVTNP